MLVGEMATEDLDPDQGPGQGHPNVGHCLLGHGDHGHCHHSQSGKKATEPPDHHHWVMCL